MKITNALMFIAIVAVALAGINLILTINKVGDFKVLSGFATDTGTANLTIQSNVQINFTTENITWGTGNVPTGWDNCELTTTGTMNCTGFSTVSSGLILENIGNENVNLSLYASKDATTFIGAGATFQWNTSEAEASSCPPGLNITSWTDVTTTMQPSCDNFTFDTTDTLEIDLRVVIPNTASKEEKVVTIIANADAII